MNRIKGAIYQLISILATMGFRKKNTKPTLLIVRVDEIGDYMLWRSFLREIAIAKESQGFEIHFCGNSSWKDLFASFDSKMVQQSVWMQKKRFKKDIFYRYLFLRGIYKQRYSCVINPTFSRDRRNDDAIVMAAKAPVSIGMVSNLENFRSSDTGYDQNLYSQLFDYPEKPVFEFIRNRLFTEFITGNKSVVINTKIDSAQLPSPGFALPEKYFVVFPGSRNPARTWPAEYFAAVASYLFAQFGWTAVICGGPDDKVYSDAFQAHFNHPVTDLTGKTSLPILMSVFKNAACLLSVDTGSVHMAAATGCCVFAIYNGSQYGRFAPYPQEVCTDFYPVYPDTVENELINTTLAISKYEFVVPVNYRLVKPEKLIAKIQEHYRTAVSQS